jgi:uncharacterized protein (TIGR00159 family)
MGDFWRRLLTDHLVQFIDIGLVLLLSYLVLTLIGDRRTLWMVRGLIMLVLAAAISKRLGLELFSFALAGLAIGCAASLAFILQSELRLFLEQLGRGQLIALVRPNRRPNPKPDTVVDQIVDAVKDLSQRRIGALMILETGEPIDDRNFSVPGVRLNSELSKELIQTIFQPTTLLHDGAILVRDSRIVSAGVILPISERTASRQLGTRHRAAMGITERVENCVCVVVSEETGSISLAERGTLNRPLTSSKLKELLEARFSQSVDREATTPSLRDLMRQIVGEGWAIIRRLVRFISSASREKK